MYFKLLSIALGFSTSVGAWLFWKNPPFFSRFLLQRIYPEKKTGIYALILLAVFSLTVYSWLKLFREPHVTILSIFVCMFLTFGLSKVVFVTFYYEEFRLLITALLSRETAARTAMAWSSLAVGIALTVFGIFS